MSAKKKIDTEKIDKDMEDFMHAPLTLEEMQKKRNDEESMKKANLRQYYKYKEKKGDKNADKTGKS
jgi:acid phosphatase class B